MKFSRADFLQNDSVWLLLSSAFVCWLYMLILDVNTFLVSFLLVLNNLLPKMVRLNTCLKSKYLKYIRERCSGSYCVKSVHIQSYSSPYFAAFELNTERYGLSLRIKSEYGKMRDRKAPNTDTFYAVSLFVDQIVRSCNITKNVYSKFFTLLHYTSTNVMKASLRWFSSTLKTYLRPSHTSIRKQLSQKIMDVLLSPKYASFI